MINKSKKLFTNEKFCGIISSYDVSSVNGFEAAMQHFTHRLLSETPNKKKGEKNHAEKRKARSD